MNVVRLDTADSTNTWVAQHEKELESPSFVYCINQTAGRGQRGNSWESEPGKNITASIYFRPKNFLACHQFYISEAIALAIVSFLREYGIDAMVKWPNDIYVGDKKICGILVEHVILGSHISRTIAGFGININQKEFISDAPNPISLTLLTGQKYDIEKSLINLQRHMDNYIGQLKDCIRLHETFENILWWKDGDYHKFFDRGLNEFIEAKIVGVAPDGILTLTTREGEKRSYAFKEVEFILTQR